MTRSALYTGRVFHKRYEGPGHALSYRIDSLVVDLDELAGLSGRLRLFGYNKAALFSFHDTDHGPRDGSALKPWAVSHLARAGLSGHEDDWRIRILCAPRVLGYVFNPISVWFCEDRSGALRAILYEVSNTFKERHCYLVPVAAGETSPYRHQVDKRFHVSPFFDLEGVYEFRTAPPGVRFNYAIRYRTEKGLRMSANHVAERRELSDRALLGALARHGHLTLKIISGIHWEAFKLWRKGAKFHRAPAVPEQLVDIAPAASPDKAGKPRSQKAA